jgi:5-methyltetrahydrofolate--homocysteine methyltransferase
MPCALIGERINPTGKKLFTEELRTGKTAYLRREAAAQVAAGAVLLDINCAVPGVDEAEALERAVYAVSGVSSAPLVIDTADPVALEKALKAADGKVLINSVSGAAESLARLLPLARRYGAALIGLALDEGGIPATAEGRVAIAGRIRDAAIAAGLPEQDLVIDCLALALSAEPGGVRETLRAVRLVRDRLGLATVLGVSNISFGLPSREILSAVFFAMALEAGLTLAIVNPKDERVMDAHRAASVLLGHDLRAATPGQVHQTG